MKEMEENLFNELHTELNSHFYFLMLSREENFPNLQLF